MLIDRDPPHRKSVTERALAEQALRHDEEHLRMAMAAAQMGTWTLDLTNFKVHHSAESARLVGLPPGTRLSYLDEFLSVVHPEDRPQIARRLRDADIGDGYGIDFRAVWPDGTVHWINGKGSVGHDDEGRALTMLGVMWDITARKQNELALDKANRALRVLSGGNQKLVHAQDEQSLLDAVCRLMVDMGGYRMAWVGAVRHDQYKSVIPVARCGDDNGYLALAAVSWDGDDPHGQGPVGTAIRSGEVQVIRDVASSAPMAPWRAQAAVHGYRSCAAFPLSEGGSVFGALAVYASASDAFNADELRLLRELSDDLAYGVAGLRRAAEQRHTQEILKLHDRAISECINGIVICKASSAEDNPITYVNPAFLAITGYGEAELIGRNTRILIGDDWDQPEIEKLRQAIREGRDARVVLRNYTKDGALFWAEISMASVHDESGQVSHFISILNDITKRVHYEAELAHQADHDSLTGLANRNLLRHRTAHALTRAARSGHTVAVIFIDLDHFKYVNDSLGHALGDELIKAVSAELSCCARDADTVARLGGDEFVVLVADLPGDRQVTAILKRLLDAISRRYQVGGHELYITASIGVSVYPRDGQDVDTLLRNADAAMYRAKECGRHRFDFFQAAMTVQASERLSLESSLRNALERGELRLHYQPQVDLNSGQVVGAEALVRWQHPELGLLPPGRFIPLAAETGLIMLIGEWVLDNVCAQLRAWLDAGLAVPRVAVNLSARQFRQNSLAQAIARTLELHGVPASLLEIEITESAAMGDVDEAVSIMRELKALGVTISMDDFGTGYSSLSYLKRFPIDTLKIDQEFVRCLTTDADAAAVCLATITLAHNMRLAVIAEGVETEGQLNYLRRHRCDMMQGYYFSRPVAPDEYAALIAAEKALPLAPPDDGPRRRTLLIVDDEVNIRSALKRALRPAGYDILTAASATEALELLATHQVQVILSDQRMPGMTGVEFLRRAKHLYPDTMRLVLSGYTELESVTEAVNEGSIYKFLTKPWDDTLLRAHLEEAFRHKEMEDDNRRLSVEIRAANAAVAAASHELEEALRRQEK